VTRGEGALWWFGMSCGVLGLVGVASMVLADLTAPAPAVAVHDVRTCAALAVYNGATADDWSQRAAIANAALNAFAEAVPDCGPRLLQEAERGIDPRRWQSALDAVDAVRSGSYDVPRACQPADSVAPSSEADGRALRSQCVIAGLVFWSSQA
jgi:hypothetical protein